MCYCVTEVLHTSCPASQSHSPKLLSSAYPPSGTSVGGGWVGGSIMLGSYWKDWKWLEFEIEVQTVKIESNHLTQSRGDVGMQTEDTEELCSKFLDIHLGWKKNQNFFLFPPKKAHYTLQTVLVFQRETNMIIEMMVHFEWFVFFQQKKSPKFHSRVCETF